MTDEYKNRVYFSSDKDDFLAFDGDIVEMTVVTTNGTFELKRPDTTGKFPSYYHSVKFLARRIA